jgi:hypothetical protein
MEMADCTLLRKACTEKNIFLSKKLLTKASAKGKELQEKRCQKRM